MRRREFISLVSGAAVSWPLAARAQQSRRRPLVGWLGGSSRAIATRNLNAFLQGLQDHGYVEGQNIDIVYRWADGDQARQPALAKELASLSPDVIVTANNPGNVAARQATTTIPIVGALVAEPLTLGLAESYNRPGRNVTGVLVTVDSLPGKQTELLLQLAPGARSIAVLANPESPSNQIAVRNIGTEVAGSSVKLVPIEARTPNDIERAFDELKRTRVDGLLVLSDAMFFTEVERILALAHAARLPAIHGFREHVERGGLMSYGVNIPQNFQRAAYFVDRILKGSRAGDLPIELPTKLELVINLKTAKALGLEVPSKLLFTADEVIE